MARSFCTGAHSRKQNWFLRSFSTCTPSCARSPTVFASDHLSEPTALQCFFRNGLRSAHGFESGHRLNGFSESRARSQTCRARSQENGVRHDGFKCILYFGFSGRSKAMSMNRLLLSIGLVVLSVFPVFAQDKEQDRVENAGKAMKEILNAPDSIPQSVLDKADCMSFCPRSSSLRSELAAAMAVG